MSQQPPPESPRDGSRDAAGRSQADLDNPGVTPVEGVEGGPGSGRVGVVGIILLTTYLVLFTLFLIYALVVVWPAPTPSRETADARGATPTPTATATATPTQTPTAGTTPTPTPTPTPPRTGGAAVGQASPTPTPTPTPASSATPQPDPAIVTFFGRQFKLWDEQRLLLLVLLAGALGSILHDLRSVYWYIGNRSLVKSWLAMYIVLPFAGATLALIFYLVIRGGFFSPQSSFKETSPFGFAAFAALIGMFSPQAVLKLREVAETLLSKPKPGPDAKPQDIVRTPATPPATPPPAGGKPPAEG